MSLEKAYEPQKYESEIYKLWEDSGAFKPNVNGSGEPFSIIMPPPNANGNLHMGHGMYVVDDILIRYHRMLGEPTLWLPGTDHAGIETQVVFESKLAAEGKSRFDFTPQEFYEAALQFVIKNEDNMLNQMRSMGFSPDWSRKKFTLDPDILEIVYETFARLVKEGHIYRGNRIVNWCPHCRSGFADIEISHREQIDPLYYIKYGSFVLATVRPETKFGDTAIAVHPKDERYKHLVGTEIEAEGLLGRFKLKVIADGHVNPEFGTGVVKVTPAHDPNDWEMGLRHKLEVKQAIGTDGRLTDICGKYAGMPVAEARSQVAKDLEERGLMDHIDMNYSHSIAYHGRCGTPIEPLVTEQWWLKVEELKKPVIKAIKDGDVKFYPTRFKKQALDWLESLRDWNISRQNWFGIRIPVYYNATGNSNKPEFIVATSEAEAEKVYGKGGFEAETDTFDTWFSSGQWPFATLMATGDFDRFYPTSVMGTMRDILYLWVTRMIMFGLYRTGQVPFKTVYLWGSVNDAEGKKMSKSKGNVINPLEMTSGYGTDAFRLALTIGVTPGTGGSVSEEKIQGYRNFCNKLWNVARFIIDKVEAESRNSERSRGTFDYPPTPETLPDKWILERFSQEISNINNSLKTYRFSDAGEAVYSLLWDDLADWLIEASKIKNNLNVLVYCLETILKLAHPFAPFVTETIWQALPWQTSNLITEQWPNILIKSSDASRDFAKLQAIVSEIRSLSVEMSLAKPNLLHTGLKLIGENEELFNGLAKLGKVTKVSEGRGLALTSSPGEAWLDVPSETIQNYLQSLHKKRTDQASYIEQLEAKLNNKQFVSSAPAQIVADTRNRQEQAALVLSKLDEQIRAIQS